ncbi:MAG: hypothetical protein M1823_006046 [Watsoniomyces obsoletus]|nr:MAG: hypothetical protein M1823_006046 [Watsoniomyces obsoletus]
MYRRLSNSLPPDPEFPADLEKLGYFLNSDDEIRSIEDPTQFFEYFINRNERYNEKNREAMNILERLHALGIETLRLPLGTPSNKPHIPILVSRNISTRKRIILVIPEALQDLGIWAYRIIGSAGKDAMNRGSAVNFVKYVKNLGLHHAGNGVNEGDGGNDENTPGIIIANTGQLVWYRGGKRAVSFTTWDSLPRKSAVHGSMRIDDVRNRVPKNSSVKEHVKYIFEEILDNGEMVKKDIEVYVIGLSDGADEVVGDKLVF